MLTKGLGLVFGFEFSGFFSHPNYFLYATAVMHKQPGTLKFTYPKCLH